MAACIIIAGAFAPELEPFRSLNNKIVKIDDQEFRILLKEAGIGNVKAALSVSRWYQEAKASNCSISEIVFVGSCGLYLNSKNLPVLQFENHSIEDSAKENIVKENTILDNSSKGNVTIENPKIESLIKENPIIEDPKTTILPSISTDLLSTDFLSINLPMAIFSSKYCSYELSTLIKPPQAKVIESLSALIQTNLSSDAKLSHRLSNVAVKAIVNSPNAVSLLPIDSNELAQRTNENSSTLFVENLEAFGMANACLELNLNFSCFLSVTNFVSKEGSIDWQKNFIAGANLLYSLLLPEIEMKS